MTAVDPGARGDVTTTAGRPSGHPTVAAVSLALARRSLRNVLRIPAAFVPILAMPIFFVIAFSGSFTSLTRLPAFPTDDMKAWVVPFATLQGAAFAGFGTGFGTVRDIESGVYDRFLLAPSHRAALLLGPALAGLVRATITFVVVVTFGVALGTDMPAGLQAVGALWVGAVGIAVVSTGWALGVVYRMPDTRSGPILQIGIFFTMFLSTGLVPLEAQTGWVSRVARWNPITPVLDLARQGYVGEVSWGETWPGLLALAGMAAVLWTFAARGLRKLTP
jgi:ABC-2 type transport system permease protein